MKIENDKLNIENHILKGQFAELCKLPDWKQHDKQAAQQLNTLLANLGKIFTPGQIRKLQAIQDKWITWTHEGIANTITICSGSVKSYRLLLQMNLPLPSVSTVKKWSLKLTVRPGILDVFLRLQAKRRSMPPLAKVVGLSFDEIHISHTVVIDVQYEKLGPFKPCVVIMARALFGKWKQLIYYNYDTNITQEFYLMLLGSSIALVFILVL